MILTIHCFLHGLPILLILIPVIALDVILAITSFIYYRQKADETAKHHAKLLQQRINSFHLPISSHSSVPFNVIPQQLPLTYSSQNNSGRICDETTTLPNNCNFLYISLALEISDFY